MRFSRPEHVAIAGLLACMDADLLARSRCFFGGGTAIVLANEEYRLSLDVDFLCADVDGYRTLRSAVGEKGAAALFDGAVEEVRAFRADQYGLRAVLSFAGQAIRFEIVREGRIELTGAVDARLGVPILSVEDQFAEKLLANADRYADKATASRDAIDLAILASRHGGLPPAGVAKAERAYGAEVPRRVASALERLASPLARADAAEALGMPRERVLAAVEVLARAAARTWPSLVLQPPL